LKEVGDRQIFRERNGETEGQREERERGKDKEPERVREGDRWGRTYCS
jgi:hypothetical protein